MLHTRIITNIWAACIGTKFTTLEQFNMLPSNELTKVFNKNITKVKLCSILSKGYKNNKTSEMGSRRSDYKFLRIDPIKINVITTDKYQIINHITQNFAS